MSVRFAVVGLSHTPLASVCSDGHARLPPAAVSVAVPAEHSQTVRVDTSTTSHQPQQQHERAHTLTRTRRHCSGERPAERNSEARERKRKRKQKEQEDRARAITQEPLVEPSVRNKIATTIATAQTDQKSTHLFALQVIGSCDESNTRKSGNSKCARLESMST